MISKPHASETLNNEFGKVTYTVPDTHYVALSTTAITEAAGLGFTEPADSAYNRVAVTNSSANWAVDITTGYITNETDIEFPAFAVTANGVSISHWFISDKENASTAGDKALYYDQIYDTNGTPTTFEIKAGGIIKIPAGNLTLGRVNPTD